MVASANPAVPSPTPSRTRRSAGGSDHPGSLAPTRSDHGSGSAPRRHLPVSPRDAACPLPGRRVGGVHVADRGSRQGRVAPRGVEDLAWSPDGRRLAVVSSSHGATREEDARRRGKPLEKAKPGEAPRSDYRFVDRLSYMRNAAGFTYDKEKRLWLVEVETGAA